MYAATLRRLETGRPGRSWGAAEHPLGDRRDEKRDEELVGGGNRRGGNGWSVKKIKVILKNEKKTRNKHLKIKIILNKTEFCCAFSVEDPAAHV